MSTTDFAVGDREEEDVILEIQNSNVRFDMSRGQAAVLNDVDLSVRSEEIIGIVGESGCGKSMLASAMIDAVVDPGVLVGDVIYRPKGREEVNLVELSESELRDIRWNDISMVFQGASDSFNPTMRIREHFIETIRAHGANPQDRLEHARDLLSQLYLNPDRIFESYPHELSGGMTQRALIALSLVLEPEVLVMDEPTGALDLLMQRSIISLLAKLKEDYELTIVFITHDLPLVTGLVDRLAVMYAFEIVELGSARDVVSDAAHPYTRALLKSVPSLQSPLEDMQPVAGESPDPINLPTGCSYRPRCPISDDRCESENPDLLEVEDNHDAACFYSEQSADAIPYTLHEGVMGGDK